MANEVAIRPTGEVAAYSPRSIIELAQSKAVIQQMMKAIMKEGVHYGTIPGTPKPCLYKAGAEIILSTFRISVDMEVEDLSTPDCIRYRVKTIGRIPDGTIVAYGIGECSSDEEKYKWKKPFNSKEYDETDPDRRRLKWFRGSGNKDDYQGQQIRTNPADLANTVLKMAKKRSQTDLTLTGTGASDVFDQDLEDLKDVIDITDYQRQGGGGKPEVKTPESTAGANQNGDQGGNSTGGGQKYDPAEKIKPGGATIVKKALTDKGISEAAFCAHMKIEKVEDLLSGDMTAGMNAIKRGEIPK